MYNWENVAAHGDIVGSKIDMSDLQTYISTMNSKSDKAVKLKAQTANKPERIQLTTGGTMIHFAREEMYLSRGDKSFISIHDEAVIQSGITKKRVFYAVIAGLLLSWAKEATLAEVVLVKMTEEEILTVKADILEEIDVLDKKLLLCLKSARIWML
ncbi:hypothetical protein Tco_0155093 [Tanacetum coccineum]